MRTTIGILGVMGAFAGVLLVSLVMSRNSDAGNDEGDWVFEVYGFRAGELRVTTDSEASLVLDTGGIPVTEMRRGRRAWVLVGREVGVVSGQSDSVEREGVLVVNYDKARMEEVPVRVRFVKGQEYQVVAGIGLLDRTPRWYRRVPAHGRRWDERLRRNPALKGGVLIVRRAVNYEDRLLFGE